MLFTLSGVDQVVPASLGPTQHDSCSGLSELMGEAARRNMCDSGSKLSGPKVRIGPLLRVNTVFYSVVPSPIARLAASLPPLSWVMGTNLGAHAAWRAVRLSSHPFHPSLKSSLAPPDQTDTSQPAANFIIHLTYFPSWLIS